MLEIPGPEELQEEPELQVEEDEYIGERRNIECHRYDYGVGFGAGVDHNQCDAHQGPCHTECADQGCDGPDADHCLNCVHFSSGSLKSGR